MSRSNPDVLRGYQGHQHLYARQLLLGCFSICSFQNGIVPDAKVKMSSLAATPVITVPLRRQETTAAKALGLTWKNWTGEEYE